MTAGYKKQLPDHMEVNRSCPNCGPNTKLRVMTNRANGGQFLGCPNYPACTYSSPIPEQLRMELEGQPTLFAMKD
jgi:ssDNA-binding Zn-finger/Zn-ribbon topoisomerase 1